MKRNRFETKITRAYTVVVLIVVVAISTVFFFYTYNSLIERERENLLVLSEKMTLELNNMLSMMDSVALLISTNFSVRDAYDKFYNGDYATVELESQVLGTLSSVSVPSNVLSFRVSILNEKGNVITSGVSYDAEKVRMTIQNPNYIEWYRSLPVEQNDETIHIGKDNWSNSDQPTLSLYREVYSPLSGNAVAVVEVQAFYKQLQEIFGGVSDGQNVYLVNTATDISAYPHDTDFNFKELDLTQPLGEYPGHIYSTTTPYFDEWCIVVTQSDDDVLLLIRSVLISIIGVALVILIIGLFVIRVVSHRLLQPLRILADNMQHVHLGNLAVNVPNEHDSDELKQIGDAFEQMFAYLKSSLDEVMMLKSQELQANYIALQAQMNPHFLFNIISVIKSMNDDGQTEELDLACDYLADIMRYVSTYSDNLVNIREELEYSTSYLLLMKFRFEEKFHYEIIHDERGDYGTMIPKLCLQPLFENCFQHAFGGQKGEWRITVHTDINQERWSATVSDNGCGIDDSTRDDIHEKVERFVNSPSDRIRSAHLGGMGLVNIGTRLRLRYGNEAVFNIENTGDGTKITIGGTTT